MRAAIKNQIKKKEYLFWHKVVKYDQKIIHANEQTPRFSKWGNDVTKANHMENSWMNKKLIWGIVIILTMK